MRLIIVEDQLLILKKMREMLSVMEEVELVTIRCNIEKESQKIPYGEEGWYEINDEDELFDLIENNIGIIENDHFLLDITLSKESQRDSEFEEYLSVRLAEYIENIKSDNVKIKFYTIPHGISVRDFGEETKKWGTPIYRPALEMEYGEEEAKDEFVKEIKEFCNV